MKYQCLGTNILIKRWFFWCMLACRITSNIPETRSKSLMCYFHVGGILVKHRLVIWRLWQPTNLDLRGRSVVHIDKVVSSGISQWERSLIFEHMFLLFSFLLDTWHCTSLVLSLMKFMNSWFNYSLCEYFVLIQGDLVSGLLMSICLHEWNIIRVN